MEDTVSCNSDIDGNDGIMIMIIIMIATMTIEMMTTTVILVYDDSHHHNVGRDYYDDYDIL